MSECPGPLIASRLDMAGATRGPLSLVGSRRTPWFLTPRADRVACPDCHGSSALKSEPRGALSVFAEYRQYSVIPFVARRGKHGVVIRHDESLVHSTSLVLVPQGADSNSLIRSCLGGTVTEMGPLVFQARHTAPWASITAMSYALGAALVLQPHCTVHARKAQHASMAPDGGTKPPNVCHELAGRQ
mmetsp:Transcript_122457/g.351908  ORF Transcript_122457/g.351908 Transcript_122457/m.351908 type:complete len:187 (-) Transcript_122457:266-826(-)